MKTSDVQFLVSSFPNGEGQYGLTFSKESSNIDSIIEAFGINGEGLGIEARRITIVPEGLLFAQKRGLDTTLAFDYWHDKESPAHIGQNPRLIATKKTAISGGWSEESFLVSTSKNNPMFDVSSTWLSEIASSITKMDCAFDIDMQGNFNLYVISKTPQNIKESLRRRDADSSVLNNLVEASGIMKRLAEKKFKATPRLNDDKSSFSTLVENGNKWGWFSVEEIDNLLSDKPVEWSLFS